ncbi:formylmethanofuran dehydrogenase, subunit E - like protein [Desulfurococcus amylolyticus 1221n]|uniref:Formylmethanofuran dehydrogenase, subunit E-like protein n=1 Tax=Desulfurococcus amylolyticus (strain DSM 18924 / JCM 16383 / VKM B-2413 / 1221n) TaxID=490899 RepID=B8D6N1_DESA1|nr:FmdE family protein [Desulfurococcus amylolyticus]ACL11762.1 formylmethanofuran dehydrogenase, subunit E - like protein [Desulfurococcus amylolyticus 1221n]
MVSKELIEKAKEFHGHVCPFLVLGLRASEIAMGRLGINKAGVMETIREDIIAIVEANNCFADGVQIATGCTLGNNSLIYIDAGKNALTLFRRGSKKGIRVYVDSQKLREKYFPREALDLFKKVVTERRGSREETEKLHKLWSEIGYKMANIPEEEFIIQEVEIVEEVERAPIYESIRCSKCGELIMAPKAIYIDGKPLCIQCANGETLAIIGRGISHMRIPYRVVSNAY